MLSTDTHADAAIDAVARQRGTTVAEILEGFALAAYRIDEAFTAPHRGNWIDEVDANPALATDTLGQGRLLRDRHNLADGGIG